MTQRAERDVKEIFEYIHKDNELAAKAFLEELLKQVTRLEFVPLRCPGIPEGQISSKEYRHLLYHEYRTIFRIEKRVVIVCRILHGARLLDLSSIE